MKKNRVFAIITLSIIIAFFTLCLTMNTIFKSIDSANDWEIKVNDNNTYFKLHHESNPMDIKVSSFNEMHHKLIKPELYTYYEFFTQPLDIEHSSKEYYDAYTMELSNDYERVGCVQISENIQDDFQLYVEKGQLLNSNDYFYDGKEIPVLMGYDYLDIFNIDDTFTGNYLYDDYDFRIIGFLKPESHIMLALKSVQFDKMIIMPSFHITEEVNETDGLRIHYANKTSGLIKSNPNSIDETKHHLLDAIENSTVGEYTIEASPITESVKMKLGIEFNIIKNTTIILGVVILLIALVLTYNLNCRINKNKSGVAIIKNNLSLSFLGTILYLIFHFLVMHLAGFITNILQGLLIIIGFNVIACLVCCIINIVRNKDINEIEPLH